MPRAALWIANAMGPRVVPYAKVKVFRWLYRFRYWFSPEDVHERLPNVFWVNRSYDLGVLISTKIGTTILPWYAVSTAERDRAFLQLIVLLDTSIPPYIVRDIPLAKFALTMPSLTLRRRFQIMMCEWTKQRRMVVDWPLYERVVITILDLMQKGYDHITIRHNVNDMLQRVLLVPVPANSAKL